MRLFSTKLNINATSFALLILRVTFGTLMIANHGYKKLAGFDTLKHKFMSFMGLSPTLSLSLAIFAEFFCAVLLILGLFTRFAALALAVTMFVAFSIAHKAELFGDGEMAAIYLATFVALFLTGPGRFSIDNLISKGK